MVDFKISKLFKKEEPILHEKGFTIEKDVLFYRDSFYINTKYFSGVRRPATNAGVSQSGNINDFNRPRTISCYHWAYTSYFGMHINLQLVSRSAI